MRVCVIGGGPSGMMAAIECAKAGKDVVLIEKNEKTGKKLYITGKGRCNITNDCDEREFLSAVNTNPKFLYSAVYSFTSADAMEFFEALGVPLKTERGNRVLPLSDKSSDILKAYNKALQKYAVEVRLNEKVLSIEKNERGFAVKTDRNEYLFDKVVVATGGITYPQTGSTGDGYKFAESFGHEIKKPIGVLNGLITKERPDLAGLTLKNVTFTIEKKGKVIYSELGELLFTHKGISGPIVLTASSKIAEENFSELSSYIDLKPALSFEQLDARILRDFEENKNKSFKGALDKLLPQRLIDEVVKRCGIDRNKKVNSITKKEREALAKTLKKFVVTITSLEDDSLAIITKGGVDVREIDPKTMQSIKCEGLYFVGEVLDVDAKTGGFNLQIANASGALCGRAIGGQGNDR